MRFPLIGNSRVALWWVSGFIVVSLLVVLFLHLASPSDGFDRLFLEVLANEASKTTYTEHAETEVVVGVKRLRIDGIYRLDPPQGAFGSISTTTVADLDQPFSKSPNSFVLQNVSLGEDVYFRLDTKSPSLQHLKNANVGWIHVPGNKIPSELSDVAVSGPILDDLALFREKGKYVSSVERIATNDRDAKQIHYVMKLSGNSAPRGSTLESLFGHVGGSGTIDVWVEEKSALISRIHFSGAGYSSTTTVMHEADELIIAPTNATTSLVH